MKLLQNDLFGATISNDSSKYVFVSIFFTKRREEGNDVTWFGSLSLPNTDITLHTMMAEMSTKFFCILFCDRRGGNFLRLDTFWNVKLITEWISRWMSNELSFFWKTGFNTCWAQACLIMNNCLISIMNWNFESINWGEFEKDIEIRKAGLLFHRSHLSVAWTIIERREMICNV